MDDNYVQGSGSHKGTAHDPRPSDRMEGATYSLGDMKVRINFCNAYSKAYSTITPGSVHEVLDKRPLRGMAGVWVMGDGEPVYLLQSEYEITEYD